MNGTPTLLEHAAAALEACIAQIEKCPPQKRDAEMKSILLIARLTVKEIREWLSTYDIL